MWACYRDKLVLQPVVVTNSLGHSQVATVFSDDSMTNIGELRRRMIAPDDDVAYIQRRHPNTVCNLKAQT